VLHLLGFDHEGAEEAETMEQIEIQALGLLDIADPYTEGGEKGT
jgi:probable rRNA maturation factor